MRSSSWSLSQLPCALTSLVLRFRCPFPGTYRSLRKPLQSVLVRWLLAWLVLSNAAVAMQSRRLLCYYITSQSLGRILPCEVFLRVQQCNKANHPQNPRTPKCGEVRDDKKSFAITTRNGTCADSACGLEQLQFGGCSSGLIGVTNDGAFTGEEVTGN